MNADEQARRALALLDLTDLGDAVTADDTHALCRRALSPHGNVAAVCLWPRWVATAVGDLAGTGVRIATVTNFPSGAEPTADVRAQTEVALADGADDIDVVLRYRDVMAGRVGEAADALRAIREIVPQDDGHVLKVILETGEIGDADTIRLAAQLAVDEGADFIKTSTGKTPVSASLAATAIMLDVIAGAGRPVGLKPSGGIRTLADAGAYLAQADQTMGPSWASARTFRFGASGLLDALLAVIDRSETVGSARNEQGY